MIEVCCFPKEHALTMHGHAGTDEKGKDLVCAAASMLAYTLAENVARWEKRGDARDAVVELREGWAEIRCSPEKWAEAEITAVFDAVCVGFELLARQNPGAVKWLMANG